MAGSRTLKLSILADVDNLKKNLDAGSKEVEGFGGKLEKFGKMAAAAFAAAAAAAAAYAGKLLIEGVKAAIEDEAAQMRLAKALQNVTGATDKQIASVEKQITKLSLANGIADDQLRPAFQRLATATGDLTTANKGLTLALDISAATGKDLNTVSNALAKAYEGNTSSLARLGVGLSTAEIKSLGLDGTMKQLAQTFGGAATTQANTLEGQIARLKVGFDEAKESVGAALLPMIQKLMDFFINVVIPKLQEVKRNAIDPIIAAFVRNKEAMSDLWEFIKFFLVPIIETRLFAAFGMIAKVIPPIIDLIAKVITNIKNLANDAIDFINRIIAGYNRLPFGDINLIPKIGGGGSTGGTSSGGATITLPGGGGTVTIPGATTPGTTGGGAVSGGTTTTTTTSGGTTSTVTAPFIDITGAKSLTSPANVLASDRLTSQLEAIQAQNAQTNMLSTQRLQGQLEAINAANTATNNLAAARYEALQNAYATGQITVVVQAPSAITEEGFQRAVVDALNEAANRGTGGGGNLRFGAAVL